MIEPTREYTEKEREYMKATMRFMLACREVEAAEAERDVARDECRRLETELGI